jgi:hypothetical protein
VVLTLVVGAVGASIEACNDETDDRPPFSSDPGNTPFIRGSAGSGDAAVRPDAAADAGTPDADAAAPDADAAIPDAATDAGDSGITPDADSLDAGM